MIRFLFEILGFYIKKICVKNLDVIFDRKNVLAKFLNGPISKKSIFFSKILQEKVMVINFFSTVIYQLNINMTPTRL